MQPNSSSTSQSYSARDGWFIDPRGRHTLLKGVNLGGSSKLPASPDGSTHLGVDFEGWADVSFVGRPFALEEADRHLDRLVHWGFNAVRLLTTWEAIEHRGPGEYDEEYLDFFREVVVRARARGILVFIDPHQDVWSRWTGGDGAPYWCFDWAGLLPEHFVRAGAVALNDFNWPSSSRRSPVASMWTLFFAGDIYCPELTGVQQRLQDHYIAAVCALAERLTDLDNVLGYDTLNEPSYGYLGQGADLVRRQGWGFRPDPFSMLDHLAVADGVRVETETAEVLDPHGLSVWRGGCPWRRAGVWDLDDDGRPRLTDAGYFTRFEGREVSPWRDFAVPFIQRFREAVRRIHPDCFIFIEGPPTDILTHWNDSDPLICNARHWYDVVTLSSRRFDPDAYVAFGERACGAAEIAAIHTKQLAGLQEINRQHMGNPPMLIGEFGIPFEMNDGAAYESRDYRAQTAALDANYRAMEATLLDSALWNYTADNTHARGDRWNEEDLSIFSLDDQEDESDIDSGGRAIAAFCRPVLRHAAGRPVRMGFDCETRRFELVIEADPSLAERSELYVPRLHYPWGVGVETSAGKAELDAERQILVWDAEGSTGQISLTLEPLPEPE